MPSYQKEKFPIYLIAYFFWKMFKGSRVFPVRDPGGTKASLNPFRWSQPLESFRLEDKNDYEYEI